MPAHILIPPSENLRYTLQIEIIQKRLARTNVAPVGILPAAFDIRMQNQTGPEIRRRCQICVCEDGLLVRKGRREESCKNSGIRQCIDIEHALRFRNLQDCLGVLQKSLLLHRLQGRHKPPAPQLGNQNEDVPLPGISALLRPGPKIASQEPGRAVLQARIQGRHIGIGQIPLLISREDPVLGIGFRINLQPPWLHMLRILSVIKNRVHRARIHIIDVDVVAGKVQAPNGLIHLVRMHELGILAHVRNVGQEHFLIIQLPQAGHIQEKIPSLHHKPDGMLSGSGLNAAGSLPQNVVGRKRLIIAEILEERGQILSHVLELLLEVPVHVGNPEPAVLIFRQCNGTVIDEIHPADLVVILLFPLVFNPSLLLQGPHILRRKRRRPPEIIALELLAADAAQEIHLLPGLHTLRHRLNADLLGHVDDGCDNAQ